MNTICKKDIKCIEYIQVVYDTSSHTTHTAQVQKNP